MTDTSVRSYTLANTSATSCLPYIARARSLATRNLIFNALLAWFSPWINGFWLSWAWTEQR